MTPTPITALSFLSGLWECTPFEMSFSKTDSGLMLGTLRETRHGAQGYFEFFRFVEDGPLLMFYPYPNGISSGPYVLTRVELDGRKVIFENPSQQKDHTIWFTVSDDARWLESGMAGVKDGQPVSQKWVFERK